MPISDFFNKDLSSVFSVTVDEPEQKDYEQGYMTSNLDLILQRARRNKSIRENKIFDYIQVENDPNFIRGVYENRSGGLLGKLVGKLSMSTQIMTILNSVTYMAKVQEFLPPNIRNLLINFQAVADTSVNLLSNLERQLTFGAIERAFFNDLKITFLGKTLSFSQITQMALNIEQNLPLVDNIKNNGLRTILSLGLEQFFPTELTKLFEAAQWLDSLNDIFSGLNLDSYEEFNINVYNRMTTYGAVPIEDIVRQPVTAYTEQPFSFNDPLGINTQTAFVDDIVGSYSILFRTALVEEALVMELNIPPESIDELVAINDAYVSEQALEAIGGNVGLPSLVAVTDATNIESYNGAVNAINSAFSRIGDFILADLGLVLPSNTKPLDHLVNLKANIKARVEMEKYGITTEDFVAIDNYLKAVLPAGQLDNASLIDLNRRLEALLGE